MIHNLPHQMFFKWCTCTIFWPSDISWCVDKCIIEGLKWWYSETSEITILCSKQTQRHFWSVLSCSKKHFLSCLLHANVCLPIVEQIHADQYEVLTITMSIELCIMYPEMLVFAHTRLAIVSGPLMPCWETTCIDFLCDAHLHPTFLFDRLKCLMLFTNLQFSSIVQHSCMVETKCSSCPGIVSVIASHQYCFFVVKICGHYVHTKHIRKKVRSDGKVFCSSQGWTRTNTGCVMC